MRNKFSTKARWMVAAAAASLLSLFATATSAQFGAFQVPNQNAAAQAAVAALNARCGDLPSTNALKDALKAAVTVVSGNGGFGLPMWASTVNRKGEVCAVVYSGTLVGDQWPGSRVISAQKASTANAFSLPGFALSSANLFFPTQNGQSLYGLQLSNPVDPAVAYAGDSANYGTERDGMLGKKIGGINVFGGGLALYKGGPLIGGAATIVGAVGVSGDTSCADHNIAWRVRRTLNLDNVPAGPNPAVHTGSGRTSDNIIYDLSADTTKVGGIVSPSGFGHATCGVPHSNPDENGKQLSESFATDGALSTGSH